MKILISTGIFPNRFDVNFGIYNLRQASALRAHGELRQVPLLLVLADLQEKGQALK